MKLQAELDKEKHKINLKQNGENISAEIDGRAYEIEAHEVEPNFYLFKHENKIYEIFVAPNEKLNEPMRVNVGSNDFEIKLTDPKRLPCRLLRRIHWQDTNRVSRKDFMTGAKNL